ncbi:hypothetical protein RhiirC2_787877 [Rhizophagus irregularis]|uniref:Uncharacterized protein n=1 Tax=Rhizophagus irregularis TaxID=588596 RepID=A0A2N1MRB2_9GLOM|nr:hypothetical protein RhiirC2_787877 [Rhizophagus irregularis]
MFNLALTHRSRSIIEKNSYTKIELLLVYTALINSGTIQKVLNSRYFNQNLLKHFRRHGQGLICQFEIDSSQKIKLLTTGDLPSKENNIELLFYFHSVSLRHVPRNIGYSINKIDISMPRQKLLQLNFSREHQLKVRHKKKLYQGISLRPLIVLNNSIINVETSRRIKQRRRNRFTRKQCEHARFINRIINLPRQTSSNPLRNQFFNGFTF